MLHYIGLGMANFAEDFLVKVETSLVHSAPALPLGAHTEHRLEALQLLHRFPHVDEVCAELCLNFHSRYIITNRSFSETFNSVEI